MEFLAALLGSKWKAPRIAKVDGAPGELGGYCGGRDMKECRRMWGERLPEICATCPD